MADKTNMDPNLRDLAFKTKSRDFMGDAPMHPDAIWGVIMETSYEEGAITLLSLIDGTASLYFSNAGAVIGSGEHEHIAALSTSIASGSGVFFSAYAAPVKKYDLPSPDHVHFYFLRDSGILQTVELDEEELVNDLYPLSPLFHAMHMLIESVQAMQDEKT